MPDSVGTNEVRAQVGDTEPARISRPGTLDKYIRSIITGRITSEARELLMAQLEQICIILLKRAQEVRGEHGRNTINTDDLDHAYEELLKPHVFIEDVVHMLEQQKEELQNLTKRSLVRHMEVE